MYKWPGFMLRLESTSLTFPFWTDSDLGLSSNFILICPMQCDHFKKKFIIIFFLSCTNFTSSKWVFLFVPLLPCWQFYFWPSLNLECDKMGVGHFILIPFCPSYFTPQWKPIHPSQIGPFCPKTKTSQTVSNPKDTNHWWNKQMEIAWTNWPLLWGETTACLY